MEQLSLEMEDLVILEEATEALMANTVRTNDAEDRLERLHTLLFARITNGN